MRAIARATHADIISGWLPFTSEETMHYVNEGAWPNKTTIDVMRQHARSRADQVSLIDGGGTITWRELHDLVDRAARAFLAKGLRYGDFVVLQLPNTAAHHILYLGLNRIGAIPVMCLPRHRKLEVSHQIRLHDAKAICTIGGSNSDHVKMVEEIRHDHPNLSVLICIGEKPSEDWIAFEEFLLVGDRSDIELEEFVANPNDLCMNQLSGGTTGVSKGIPHTHNFHVGLWDHWGRGMGYTDESVFLCTTPVGHQASCAFSGASFLRGGKVVLANSNDPEEVLRLIEAHRVTHTLLFPVQINRMLQLPSREKYDLSSLKVVIYGGQKIIPSLIQRTAQEMNANVVHTFGMTEGPASFGRWDAPLDAQMHTVGRPLYVGPAWKMRLIDANNCDVPDGEIGELAAKGAFTIRGYFRAPDANEKSFDKDGFFHTGDLMLRRSDGRYVVMGRRTEMIIRGGENIYPGPIEAALVRHPHLRNAAVIGMPHEHLDETLCAFIEVHADSQVDLATVREFLNSEGLAVFQCPEHLIRVEVWPWTSAGKIDKTVLRAFIVGHLLQIGRVTHELAESYLGRDRISVDEIPGIIASSKLKARSI